jgi:hypothetical protein
VDAGVVEKLKAKISALSATLQGIKTSILNAGMQHLLSSTSKSKVSTNIPKKGTFLAPKGSSSQASQSESEDER